MTNVAGFRLDIAGPVNFGRMVGKFNFPLFVVDSDTLDSFLFADILNDLVDIITGIVHHGVVGTQLDGIAEPLGFSHYFFTQPFFLVPDAEVRPGGNDQEQNDSDPDNQLGDETVTKISN